MSCIRPEDTGNLAALLKTLSADYGTSFQKIDRGYPVMHSMPGAAVVVSTEGANDRCATYTEILQAAVSLATTEFWGSGRQRLFNRLFSEHKIELPWVVARPDLSAAIIEQVNEIKGRKDSTPQKLIHRIYHEMLPINAFAAFAKNPFDPNAINPQEGVWKLYAYARLAGLDPRFVLVRRDKNGVGTHHVAMKVHGTLIDPAYNLLSARHQETVEISLLQALSYRNLHHAANLRSVKDIAPLLDQAQVLDPSNQRAKVYTLLVSQGGDDPLRPMRDSMMVQIVAAWL